MDSRQQKQYLMLMRLKQFGAAYASRFQDDVAATEAFRSIDEALTQLNIYSMRRLTARKDVRARSAAKAALVKAMGTIARSARLLKAMDPEFPGNFLLPAQDSAQALLATARMFVEQAEPLAEKFRAHSLGSSFPENFKRLLQRYEDAIEGRERGKGLTTEARRSIEEALTSGTAAAQRLDIIVETVLGDDEVAFDVWRRNRRVGHRVGKDRPEDTVVTPAPAPAPPALVAPSAAANAIDAGTDASDALMASESAAPASVDLAAPVDLDVGDTSVVSPPFSDAPPLPAAETEGEEAA